MPAERIFYLNERGKRKRSTVPENDGDAGSKADFGAAGISYSDDRAKNVDFSINYSVSKQVVIVSNNSNINNVNNISNKKIAVQLGSIADTFVPAALSAVCWVPEIPNGQDIFPQTAFIFLLPAVCLL